MKKPPVIDRMQIQNSFVIRIWCRSLGMLHVDLKTVPLVGDARRLAEDEEFLRDFELRDGAPEWNGQRLVEPEQLLAHAVRRGHRLSNLQVEGFLVSVEVAEVGVVTVDIQKDYYAARMPRLQNLETFVRASIEGGSLLLPTGDHIDPEALLEMYDRQRAYPHWRARYRVNAVVAMADFTILVDFADGTKKIVDLTALTLDGLFTPIKSDPQVFATARVVGGYPTVGDGLRLCPLELFAAGSEVARTLGDDEFRRLLDKTLDEYGDLLRRLRDA